VDDEPVRRWIEIVGQSQRSAGRVMSDRRVGVPQQFVPDDQRDRVEQSECHQRQGH
jgi:hypothetical protein